MSLEPTRRNFIQGSAAAAVAASIASRAYAAGNDTLRVGLIGCGGRGTGAAKQALCADANTKLTAMGDAFSDRIESSLNILKKESDIAGRIDVPAERCYTGFDAYKRVIEQSDVVLLATPPNFRPMHLRAAVEANKHVFAEKPVAVDSPGVRSVLESCTLAEQKKLSIVSGLCMRYDGNVRDTIAKVHAGAIGRIVAMQANDYRGPIWVKPRQPNQTDMEYQMRNWYYFNWLSGDFNVEQHVHMLDVCLWAIGDKYPAKAIATGGRIQRNAPEYGNIYDHFAVTYTYENGVPFIATCRQQSGCKNEISAIVHGTEGRAEFNTRGSQIVKLNGEVLKDTTKHKDHYQIEHDELFASIRSGKPINNGVYMSYSTLLAIQGRMAAYTGQEISWTQAMNSTQDLTPPHFDWKQPLAQAPVAIPGQPK
ncbi:MAG TPA: Gfo/Idh/MocA family oxidoreductase [Planctomycetota bacterium]|nr:Gfo/Idh/MocA family oxidoreductase [Planctomycetota bacterium]